MQISILSFDHFFRISMTPLLNVLTFKYLRELYTLEKAIVHKQNMTKAEDTTQKFRNLFVLSIKDASCFSKIYIPQSTKKMH